MDIINIIESNKPITLPFGTPYVMDFVFDMF